MMKYILCLVFLSIFVIESTCAQRYRGNNNHNDRNNNNNYEGSDSYRGNQLGGQSGYGNQGTISGSNNPGSSNNEGPQRPTAEQLRQALRELQDILDHENDGTRFGGGGGFMSMITNAGRGFCGLLNAFGGRGNGGGFGSGISSVIGGGSGSSWGGNRRPGQGGYGQGGGYGEYTGYDKREETGSGSERPAAFGSGQSSSNRRPSYGYNDDGSRGK